MEAIMQTKCQLGASPMEKGIAFGIYAEDIDRIELRIYKIAEDTTPFLVTTLNRKDHAVNNIFSIYIEGVSEGMAYEWYVKKEKWIGPLIDPYAYQVVPIDSKANQYRNIIRYKEEVEDTRPRIPWSETVIYELHVGNFTNHPSAGVQDGGTFEGLIEKLSYFKEMGVTTIELLPVMIWNERSVENIDPKTGEELRDVWGYNPINFFSVMPNYVAERNRQNTILSFKNLVEEAHKLGLEIILDVVYNHTGEGGEGGDIFNLKALADKTYYRKIGECYLNHAGTGNTLDTCAKVVQNMVIESLRYWINVVGVDGFRFDLASILGQNRDGWWSESSLIYDIAEDDVISKVKLISESWDAKGGYDVGRMPYPVVEWSDYFRDTIRRVIRGDNGEVMNLARCLLSRDISYSDLREEGHEMIHFVTAHDGFTLWDLVSYNTKHNERNGEQGRDGSGNNYSYNCGYEGETTNLEINKLRLRKIKNSFVLLMLAKGVPMIVMGDEGGRTQQGNNNAYCQNNEISWLDWERMKQFEDVQKLLKDIIQLRKETRSFSEKLGYRMSWHGVHYNKPDWGYYSRTLAMLIENKEETYYIIINNYSDKLHFELPDKENEWQVVIDTSLIDEKKEVVKETYEVAAFTVGILKKSTKNSTSI